MKFKRHLDIWLPQFLVTACKFSLRVAIWSNDLIKIFAEDMCWLVGVSNDFNSNFVHIPANCLLSSPCLRWICTCADFLYVDDLLGGVCPG